MKLKPMIGEQMNKIQTTTIFLAPIEAELFIKFQKHHELFKLLVESKVFDYKNANIMLNFDANGNIGSIERHDILYSARHDKLSPST